jgi:Pvc16 N-terminal domain
MATFAAIAAVTRTLRTLLLDRMITGAQVTLAPPDVSVAGVDGARVNLYLCEVVENAALKNQEVPGVGHPGAFGRPPLWLNLRFLLTTYSDTETQTESDLNAQTILGDAMRVLHDFGLSIDTLKISNPAAGLVGDPVLDDVLVGEFERVKIVLHSIPLDEITRIWSALPDANFRRSVLYEATVVQIETPMPRPRPQPVETRRIVATIRRRPQILAAFVTPVLPTDPNGEMRVRIGDQITILADHAIADRLFVRLGALEPIRISPTGSAAIQITVPDAQYPVDLDHPATRPIPPGDRLETGPLEIQLIAEHPADGVSGGLDRGAHVETPRRYVSNSALLQLVPRIDALTPTHGPAGTILEVSGARLWRSSAKSAEVIVGDAAVAIRPLGGQPAPSPTSVRIAVSEAAAALPAPPALGTPYPVAVQLDGARSRDAAVYKLEP